MGLDIYLTTDADNAAEKAYSEAWDELWSRKDSGEITEAEYDELRKELPSYPPKASVPAQADPEHLCDRRYLRSSYNASGFNRVVENTSGQDLYGIFEDVYQGDQEEYPQQLTEADIPGLRSAAAKARATAEAFSAWDRLQVAEIGRLVLGSQDHLWSEPPTEGQFLEWVRGEFARREAGNDSFTSYSTGKGDIFAEGMTIVAASQGRNGFFGSSCLVAVRADDSTVEHYRNTALIAAEFCEEAISLIERDGRCWLGWSG